MECSENILSGKAQALDIPIDSIKEFVALFNSHVPSHCQGSTITADINDLIRSGQNVSLKWTESTKSGEFVYEIYSKTFNNIVN